MRAGGFACHQHRHRKYQVVSIRAPLPSHLAAIALGEATDLRALRLGRRRKLPEFRWLLLIAQGPPNIALAVTMR